MSTGQFRTLVRKYGVTAIGTYCTISAATFWSLYFAIENQVDVKGSLQVRHKIPKFLDSAACAGMGFVAFSFQRDRGSVGRERTVVQADVE